MFKKKTIQNYKKVIKELNANRMELAGENIAYQRVILAMKNKIDEMYEVIMPKESTPSVPKKPKKKTTKKTTKKGVKDGK